MIRRSAVPATVFLCLSLAAGSTRAQDVTDALTTFAAAKFAIGQKNLTSGECDQGKDNPGKNSICDPSGAVAAGAKLFYLPDSDNARVLGFKSIPKKNDASAKFVLGQTNFSSSSEGVSSTAFEDPTAVATDGTHLFMNDFSASRVLIWNKLPNKTSTPADLVLGQPNFTSDTATTTQSGLSLPETGLFVVGGKLIVSDRNNNRVMIWNSIPTANGANADVVVGQTDFTSAVTAVTQTNLNEPEGLWSDGTKLVVADFMNNRVMIWNTFPTTNGAPADVVLGQTDFTSFEAPTPPTSQSLDRPGGVASDGTRLFVEDSGNARILVFNTFPTANDPAADIVLGQPDFTHNDANGGSSTPTAMGFGFPFGMSIIGNQLFVDDESNNRFVVFSLQ
jgi:hypothetical protein